jgi:uncharacterized protein (TIGR03067 family)
MPARLLVAAAVALALTAFAPAPLPRPDKKDKASKETLQGTWTLVKIERGGNQGELSVKGGLRRKVRIAGDKWSFLTVRNGRESATTYTVVVDPKKDPKWIDLTRAGGRPMVQGVYRLEGDTLKMLYGRPGGNRPASFARPEAGLFLMTLKREKP